jgi:hypothetical protein
MCSKPLPFTVESPRSISLVFACDAGITLYGGVTMTNSVGGLWVIQVDSGSGLPMIAPAAAESAQFINDGELRVDRHARRKASRTWPHIAISFSARSLLTLSLLFSATAIRGTSTSDLTLCTTG